MPIFSLIITGILIYIAVFSKGTTIDKFYKIFTIDCVVRLFFMQGYFIKIGSKVISRAADVCDLALLIYAIMILWHNKQLLKNKVVISGLCLLAISIIGIVLELAWPYEGLLLPKQNLMYNWDLYVAGKCSMIQYYPSIMDYAYYMRHLLIFVIIVAAFKMVFNIADFVRAYMNVIRMAKYGIYYGWLEFFLKNIVNNPTITYDFTAIMFGVDEEACAKPFFKGIFYALQGFTREPSHFNVFIFSVVMLMILGFFIAENLKDSMHIKLPYSKLTIISGILLLLMTGGFSAVWYICILPLGTAMLMRQRINITSILKHRGAISSGICCCAVFLFMIANNDYFTTRLQNAFHVLSFISNPSGSTAGLIQACKGDGSTASRLISIYEGINIFMHRPLLGLGYKIQDFHDNTVTYLVNMGLIGYYFFWRFLVSSIKSVKYDKLYLGVVFIIGGLPVIMSAYGLCVYWLLFIEGSMIARKENKLLLGRGDKHAQ